MSHTMFTAMYAHEHVTYYTYTAYSVLRRPKHHRLKVTWHALYALTTRASNGVGRVGIGENIVQLYLTA